MTVIGPLLGGYLFAEWATGAPHALSAVFSIVLLVVLVTVVGDPSRGAEAAVASEPTEVSSGAEVRQGRTRSNRSLGMMIEK